ncbi:hypothetical protein GCM10022226_30650 [Sphaerisporangium flaviroseum]|uniref:Phenyloxazoline synthase MbtB n=1 Tax=Sphaerisporangium flaviroseum TaxID=509199 RepID=A0ABP7I1X6_9ACTN
MSHVQVLREIESRGLSIAAAGNDLRLQGPRERMDPDLIGRIKAHKTELIAHLSALVAGQAREFPLTPLQRGYLLGRGDMFEMGNVANHVYFENEGCWDLDRLEAALRQVIERHGMLRTRFTESGQIEEETAGGFAIGRLDLRGQSEAEQERRRRALREERSHRMLPVDRAPLLAVDVTILSDERMVLHVSEDGLVMDGISAMIFMRDWWEAYRDGPGEAPPQEASFEAYVAALEAARTRPAALRSREYWFARLDDLAPHPDLPLRTSPAAITHPRFVPRTVRMDAAPWAELKARASRAGLTPASLLLAAYGETLAAWGAGPRFTVTTTVADRPPIHPRVLGAIGAFSDTMLVEMEIDRSVGFTARARALQTRLRGDLDNRHFSGVEVMRELGRRRGAAGARMPFTFNCAIGYVQADLDGSTFELFGPQVYSVGQTPQVWLNVFAREQHGGLVIQIDGVDELFPEGLLGDLVEGYQRLLDRLLDEEAWSATVFDLVPEAQRARRRLMNDTATPRPEALLQDAFAARAVQAPEAPAILTTGATMSYGELYDRARHAAAWLRARGAGRDTLVGLVMTRGPEQIVAIMATLMAGAAYLPVDAELPERRRRYMLRDGRVRHVLTNAGWTDEDDEAEVLSLDATRPLGAEPVPDVPPAEGAHPGDLAYVLYTSGTTGEPKGVMVSHRSVANVVADCGERFAIGPDDRFFAVSAFTFDLSVYDVFGALGAGAAIVMPDHATAADPAHWLELCERAGVTVWNSVPAIVSLLLDQAVKDRPQALATLRLVMMSGDRIPPTLPVALRGLKDDLTLVSLGGPTETTIWNILHPIGPEDDGSRSIPYGRPNANNRAYVLGPDGQDLPDWVAGEICAAGTGLARGYWGDQARTGERFRYDEALGELLYRTGDIGRHLPTGEIEILGRADHQLKVNGYRIEAGEIEARLTGIDGVRDAVVLRQEGTRGDRLVAHLVADGEARPPDESLSRELRTHLPGYMIPSAYTWHASLPLTRNGKVDRGGLAAVRPGGPVPAPAPGQGAAASELERAIAALWASVLKLPDVPVETGFVDLGGDSIAAAGIATRVRKEYGVVIPLHRLPEVATVRAMAAYVERGGA